MSQTLRHLGLLLAVTTAVQIWSVRHAVTTAPDAVRYVALADEMDERGWLATIRAESEHPLFPTLVWLTRKVLAAAWGDFPDLDAASATWASTVPLILAIIPVYLLLRRLAGPRPAFIGGLLFAALPRIAMLGADGLSDGIHLLLATTSLAAIAEFLERLPGQRSARNPNCPPACLRLLCGGVALGLALTARAEAILILPAWGLCIGWMQARGKTRVPWPAWSVGLFSLGAGLVCVLGMYFVLLDVASSRAAIRRLLGRGDVATASTAASSLEPTVAATHLHRLPGGAAMSFDRKESSVSSRFRGWVPAMQRYTLELARTLQPAGVLLAIAGAWLLAQRGARPPQVFAGCVFVVVSAAAVLHASQAGYLQSRHLMLAVVVSLAPAGAAAEAIGSAIANQLKRLRSAATVQPSRFANDLFVWTVAAVALATVLPLTMRPLHATRSAHRAAADWLRSDATNALVLDSRGLTGLYSGLPTHSYQAARTAFASPRLGYVVIEQGELLFDSPRALTLRHLLASSAEEAARFSHPAADRRRDVVVYRWQPERFAHLVLPQERIAQDETMVERLR